MKLYNTLTRTVEELKTLHDKQIKLYTCGLTVYSHPHIGNWVGYIYWDILTRALRASGYDVIHVQNYTDVGHLVSDDDTGEDKMEKGAKAEGLTAWKIAEKYIRIAETEGYDMLGLTRPTVLAKATDYIDRQIEFVKGLESKGFTYVIAGEGIYFDTSKYQDYGHLARLDIAGLQAGARVAVAGKRNITDFALWKFSPASGKRDMEWDSTWGRGFPGWHLECSTIAREHLGDQLDIHAGGIDHIPIHHTNEIAQTECLTGTQFARVWLHNNHLKVDGKKMSKSLGNVHTLQNIIDKGYDLQSFKILILAKHYQTEGNFTWDNLKAAENRLKNWQAISDLRWQIKPAESIDLSPVIEKLMNDLDTPGALIELEHLFHELEQNGSSISNESLQEITNLLGLDLAQPDISADVKELIGNREHARASQDWTESDRIRDELQQAGIGVRDTEHGPIWSRI